MKHFGRFGTLILVAILAACGGGGGGGGGDSGGGTGGVSVPSFITWTGSANGSVVYAANNVQVQFLANSNHLYYQNTDYSNAAVAGATLYLDNVPFASVVLVNGAAGSRVAALICPNGNYVQIVLTGTGITLDCSGAATAGTNPGRTFITWDGSANGSVVLAANNVPVKFIAGSGRLYYSNVEYSNVYVSGSTVLQNGAGFATVTLVNGSAGFKVAVMRCPNGNTVRIVPIGTTISLSCT